MFPTLYSVLLITLATDVDMLTVETNANFSMYKRKDFLKLCKQNKAVDIGTDPTLVEFDSSKFGVYYQNCKLAFRTQEGLGFTLIVHSIDFPENCELEHIKIHSFPSKKIKHRSEAICGAGGAGITPLQTNSFREKNSNSLIVSYERHLSFRRHSSFLIVLTPLLKEDDCSDSSSMFFRCGNTTTASCVPRSVLCDGAVSYTHLTLPTTPYV